MNKKQLIRDMRMLKTVCCSGLVEAKRTNYTDNLREKRSLPRRRFYTAVFSFTRDRCEKNMKTLVWVLVVILLIIHQDFWFWEDSRLVFGFIPIGLFYHACISIAAGIVWYVATVVAWPEEIDFEAEEQKREEKA